MLILIEWVGIILKKAAKNMESRFVDNYLNPFLFFETTFCEHKACKVIKNKDSYSQKRDEDHNDVFINTETTISNVF